MNCDQAFAILTQGPFPSGKAVDAAVEQHLNLCPTCWRIAEALRPAGDVFEESLPAAERRELPVYRARQLAPAQAMAARTQPQQRATPAGRPLPRTILPQGTPRSTLAPAHLPLGDATWINANGVLAMLLVAVVSVAAVILMWM